MISNLYDHLCCALRYFFLIYLVPNLYICTAIWCVIVYSPIWSMILLADSAETVFWVFNILSLSMIRVSHCMFNFAGHDTSPMSLLLSWCTNTCCIVVFDCKSWSVSLIWSTTSLSESMSLLGRMYVLSFIWFILMTGPSLSQ